MGKTFQPVEEHVTLGKQAFRSASEFTAVEGDDAAVEGRSAGGSAQRVLAHKNARRLTHHELAGLVEHGRAVGRDADPARGGFQVALHLVEGGDHDLQSQRLAGNESNGLRDEPGFAPMVVDELDALRVGEADAEKVADEGAAGRDYRIGAASLTRLQPQIDHERIGQAREVLAKAKRDEQGKYSCGDRPADQPTAHAGSIWVATAEARSALWWRAFAINVSSVGSGRTTMNIW